jgi:PAS domain S-box-containing protein
MIQGNRIVYANPAFIRLFGYTSEELLTLPDYLNIFHTDDRQRVRTAIAEQLAGVRDAERYSVRGMRKDGTIFTVDIHGSKTRYRGVPAIIGTMMETGN